MEDVIEFHSLLEEFDLPSPSAKATWLVKVADGFNQKIGGITYVFCSDEYLLEMNKEHLDHDYFTDILTFPLHEEGQDIQSDIFISLDRVRENASDLGFSFQDELDRVMVHGLLHLLGQDDHGEENQKKMRAAEDHALSLRD